MSACWKCQRELPAGQVECENGCDRAPIIPERGIATIEPEFFATVFEKMIQRERESLSIDFDKVKTFEDLKLVLEAVFGETRYHPESFPGLKPFLKQKEQP